MGAPAEDRQQGGSPAAVPDEDASLVDLGLIRQLMDQAIPFNRHLGLVSTAVERGRYAARMPFRPELVGDPMRPALHGGVISMMADTVGGGAVFTQTRAGDRVATIDLRVDYLRPGRLEELFAEAEVVRLGNRVGVSTIKLFHAGGRDAPVAVAMGVYTIRRAAEAAP